MKTCRSKYGKFSVDRTVVNLPKTCFSLQKIVPLQHVLPSKKNSKSIQILTANSYNCFVMDATRASRTVVVFGTFHDVDCHER